jgi:hypothetical protein
MSINKKSVILELSNFRQVRNFCETAFKKEYLKKWLNSLNHPRWIDPAVKFLLGEVAELEGSGFEG